MQRESWGRARARRHGRVNFYIDEGRERERIAVGRAKENQREREVIETQRPEGERGNRNPGREGIEGEK